jgi:hypothetical protein
MAAPRRITVVSPQARVDVALPLESTLAELLPQLVAMAGTETVEAGVGWTLSRLGEADLPGGATVARSGIRDGEVLYLTPRRREAAPLVFDDVVDAIAGGVDRSGRRWAAGTTRRCGHHVVEDDLGRHRLPGREVQLLAVLDAELGRRTVGVQRRAAQPGQRPAAVRHAGRRDVGPHVPQEGGQDVGQRYVVGYRQVDPRLRGHHGHPGQPGRGHSRHGAVSSSSKRHADPIGGPLPITGRCTEVTGLRGLGRTCGMDAARH